MTDFSYQLYSSRNFPPLSDTLAMVARHGYAQVEGYGALYQNADAVSQLRGLLDANGLAMPSGHFGLDHLENDPQGVLSIAADLGIELVVCPYLPADQRPGDAAGYVELGRRLQAAGAPFRDAGLQFGWHNHDFEFAPLSDGSVPLARIFEGGPDLLWEVDAAWIARGGADPAAWISQESARVISTHVKDIAPAGTKTDEDGWADVGDGTMDWAGLMTVVKATPNRFLIMEHDNPSDDERFAQRSIAAAKSY